MTLTNNSPSRDYSHPDDQTTQITETPGFKPFTVLQTFLAFNSMNRTLKCAVEQYFTVVLFVSQFYPVCNFEKKLSVLDLELPGVKGLKPDTCHLNGDIHCWFCFHLS